MLSLFLNDWITLLYCNNLQQIYTVSNKKSKLTAESFENKLGNTL